MGTIASVVFVASRTSTREWSVCNPRVSQNRLAAAQAISNCINHQTATVDNCCAHRGHYNATSRQRALQRGDGTCKRSLPFSLRGHLHTQAPSVSGTASRGRAMDCGDSGFQRWPLRNKTGYSRWPMRMKDGDGKVGWCPLLPSPPEFQRCPDRESPKKYEGNPPWPGTTSKRKEAQRHQSTLSSSSRCRRVVIGSAVTGVWQV